MIPKQIFYCWFGPKELPKSVKKCIASWKKHCPDYTITEINEDNFDVNAHPYTAYFYKRKQYAFVSDYARLKAVYDNGGIYMDTDVELLKPLDPLLGYKCYFGFEYKSAVNTGHGFGCEIHHPILANMLNTYDNLMPENNKYQAIICTKINTDALIKYGLQLNGKSQFFDNGQIAVFSPDYFNPTKTDGTINRTEHTFSVHWFDASWKTPALRLRIMLGNLFKNIFGDYFSVWLRKKLHMFNK